MLLRELRGLLHVAADDGQHAFLRPSGGLRHQLAATHRQRKPVLAAQRLRRHQRAQLAERVPGERHRRDALARERPAGDAPAEDRRLGKARALADARERVVADELQAALQQVGNDARHALAQIGCLAPLAGEQAG